MQKKKDVHVILNSHVGFKKKQQNTIYIEKHYNVLKFEKHSMIVLIFLTNAAATKLDTCQSAFE